MAIFHPLYPVLQEREHCVKSKADFGPWPVHWLSFFICAMGLVPASQGCGDDRRREGSIRAQSNLKGGTYVDMLWSLPLCGPQGLGALFSQTHLHSVFWTLSGTP